MNPGYTPPEDAHAPRIAAEIERLAAKIYGECGASKVVIYCVFTYDSKAASGKLKLKMDVSSDARMERNDGSMPRFKGTKAALAAERTAANVLKRYGRKP